MKNLTVILAFIVSIFVTSCKKDEVATPAKSKKELLTAKTWIISEVNIFSGSVVVYKRGNTANTYDLDKVSLKFNNDGTLSATDDTGKAVTGAKWVLSSDESKVTISNTGILGLDGDLPLVQIQENLLEVKGKVNVQGIPVEANIKATPK
ncbi:MAG: hypothetical protein MUF58_07485 [Arcicella sp.]|jgi:hypothetical protein|nr:hypothetical protein [Arcicella sp.]